MDENRGIQSRFVVLFVSDMLLVTYEFDFEMLKYSASCHLVHVTMFPLESLNFLPILKR